MSGDPNPSSPPPRPDPPAPAPKKSSTARVLLIVGAVLLLLVVVFVVFVVWPNRWIVQKYTDEGPHTITYEVTGDGGTATVRFTGADGQAVTQTVDLPWNESFTAQTGMPLELQAGQDTDGTISCRIKWEGHTFVFRTSFGSSPTCSVGGPA